jgi:hypothetical protein
MRKTHVLQSLVMLLAATSFAQASDSPATSTHWLTDTLIGAGGLTVAVVGVGITVYSANGLQIQVKAAYVQQLQEDAADYLAEGNVTALLSEMIAAVREANPGQAATASEISAALLEVNSVPNR